MAVARLMSTRTLSPTLLVATKEDVASMNMATHLIRRFDWRNVALPGDCGSQQRVLRCSHRENSTAPLFMWLVDEPLLPMNHANKRFLSLWPENQRSQCWPNDLKDILFLSKHAAASGTLSLTVHPIGIPWVVPEDEINCTRSGGIAGRCAPPSPHIGPLYRAILSETKSRGLDSMFQVTLEATHHGPFVDVPACFVEIGSTESEWDNVEAGDNWSLTLGEYFQLSSRAQPLPDGCVDAFTVKLEEAEDDIDWSDAITIVNPSSGMALLTIGAGHYVPKMNDMARYGENFYVGHALATYALQQHMIDGTRAENGIPKWKQVIEEAVQSTRIAHPERPLACYVDKKSFNAEQRDKITNALEELQVRWSFKAADIRSWA